MRLKSVAPAVRRTHARRGSRRIHLPAGTAVFLPRAARRSTEQHAFPDAAQFQPVQGAICAPLSPRVFPRPKLVPFEAGHGCVQGAPWRCSKLKR